MFHWMLACAKKKGDKFFTVFYRMTSFLNNKTMMPAK